MYKSKSLKLGGKQGSQSFLTISRSGTMRAQTFPKCLLNHDSSVSRSSIRRPRTLKKLNKHLNFYV